MRYLIISGIQSGDSGTGRFISYLEEQISHELDGNVALVGRPDRLALWQIRNLYQKKLYRRLCINILMYFCRISKFWMLLIFYGYLQKRNLILLHPQNLGYSLSLFLLKYRSKATLLFLLDSSFFCISSYNHIIGENNACIRCIDFGFDEIKLNNCSPFPRADKRAIKFTVELNKIVRKGKVRVVAQNEGQAKLAKKQFQLSKLPAVVGLWTKDWDDLYNSNLNSNNTEQLEWDVLFHAHPVNAKGVMWAIELAKNCKSLKFFFPFARPENLPLLENCTFLACTWESGLRKEIQRSRFVLVPSLWSAPIEGALIKSILSSRAVLVVENQTAFCGELPYDLILRLPPEIENAKSMLHKAVRENWAPREEVLQLWKNKFHANRRNCFKSLLGESGNA
ncbi:hypothetical protein G6704_01745 [Polynucleobacter paneuropaeus]|nr:hypothetical protein G6704_01745 [Polynucleobacter paneuropaeus]